MRHRICAICDTKQPQTAFSKNQWSKAVGVSKCIPCVSGQGVKDEAHKNMSKHNDKSRHPDTQEELKLLLMRKSLEKRALTFFGMPWEAVLEKVDKRDADIMAYWAESEGVEEHELVYWAEEDLQKWGTECFQARLESFDLNERDGRFRYPYHEAVLYFDGGARPNPGVGGAGFVLRDNRPGADEAVVRKAVCIFSNERDCSQHENGQFTSNEAEYVGLIEGLFEAR